MLGVGLGPDGVGAGAGCGEHPWLMIEQLAWRFEVVDASLGGGRWLAAEREEGFGTVVAAEAAGDLLGDLHHPDVSLAQIVVEWAGEVGGEAVHVGGFRFEHHEPRVGQPSCHVVGRTLSVDGPSPAFAFEVVQGEIGGRRRVLPTESVLRPVGRSRLHGRRRRRSEGLHAGEEPVEDRSALLEHREGRLSCNWRAEGVSQSSAIRATGMCWWVTW